MARAPKPMSPEAIAQALKEAAPAAQTMPSGKEIPESDAKCVDLYYKTRERRLMMEKKVAIEQQDESFLKQWIISKQKLKGQTMVGGRIASVELKTKARAIVKDWNLFYAHIRKTAGKGGFAFLNRAPNSKAIAEVWEAGKQVPGIEREEYTDLSVHKR